MIDVSKILTQVLASSSGKSGSSSGLGGLLGEAQKVLQQQGGVGGVLQKGQDMLRGNQAPVPVKPGQPPAPASGGGGALGGLGGLLSGQAGGLAAGAAAGVLASVLMGSKGGRKVAGSAVKLGALAAIGGLAWKAYQNYQSGQPAAASTQAAETAALPPPANESPAEVNDHALLLLRSMIAAAASDGRIDDEERTRIVGALEHIGLTPDEAGFLDGELRKPVGIDTLVAGATAPERKSEVYLAALLAIEADTTAEHVHLAKLAARLDLDDQLVAHLTETAAGAKAPA
jgi:uncharacterized membrane protein YebE (DUF533 family)